MTDYTYSCSICEHSEISHKFDTLTGDVNGKLDPNNPFMWTCRICKSDKYHEVCME